jgi:hypothetical protein
LQPLWRVNRYEGLKSFVGETTCFRIEVVPSYGGKTVSLQDKRTGREWLDAAQGLSPRRPHGTDEDWEIFDRSGWDECFPTVDPCAYPDGEWVGRYIPDHGEVWRLEWEGCAENSGVTPALLMGVDGQVLPYRFEKTVRLISDEAMLIEYSVENRSSSPFAFLWAMHPLFRVEPGMELRLGTSVDEVAVSYSAADRLGERGTTVGWPSPRPGVDLSIVGRPTEGTAEKYYVKSPLVEGYAEIRHRETGESLTLQFDPASIPFLAVWTNYGGWNGGYHLALEPASGYLDRLDEAIRTDRVLRVPEQGKTNWQVKLSLQGSIL